MSGFVLNLLSRSRGTADVVRPRLASLFEPAEPRASPMDGQLPQELDGEEKLSTDGRAATSPPLFAELTPSRSSHGLQDEPAIGAPGNEPRRVAARLLTPQGWPSAISAHARATLPVDATDVAAHEQSDRIADLASPKGLGGHAAEGLRHQRDDVSVPRRTASARPADSAGLAAFVERSPLERSDTDRRPESHRLATRATSVAAPALVPGPTPRFRFEPPASRTPAIDPIVEVSIGRIEVRAVVERGADRKASSGSPVMGLEEYLKARRGGAR